MHWMDMSLTLTSSLMRSVHSKKNRWCCLRVFVSLVTGSLQKFALYFDGGPKGCPNNLSQPAWRLAELFFWSDMSWSQANLCAYSYVISTHFSFLSKLPSCTHYISNVGIKTGLNSFRNFPYVTTFLLRSISIFYLWKTESFWKELSPPETVIFGPRNFGKRSSSEILDQCDFRKNGVWRKFSDSLLSHLFSKNTWTSAILERMESYNFFCKAYYCIYLIQTPSWRIRTRTILERIDSKFNSYVRKSWQDFPTVSTYYFCKATSIFTNLVFLF